MKIKQLPFILFIFFIFFQENISAQIGINASNTPPAANAMLDISSTTKGLLIPRMTTAQRNALSTSDGLTVYDTDTKGYWFYNGTRWKNLSTVAASSPWLIVGDNIYNSNIGNTGIGTTTPTLAKLHVQGMVGNMVAMFRGSSTSQGISFADDWPGIYFNSYWNDGLKSMSATGYPSFINSEQSNGDISFNLSDVPITAANALVTAPERMRITSTGQLGIGTAAPAASAILDVSSTTKGFLPPRMTITQRNAITNPEVGLVIFCTDCDELQFYNGSLWKNLGGTLACQISGPPSITICNQVWALKNVDVKRYRNGDLIPQVTDVAQWASLTTGAWCWYNNDSTTYESTYGKLYNWYAVNDSRGLAPQGWHIPSDVEWTTLFTCLGGNTVAGGKMKETGTAHWLSPNTGANNNSGFTGLPGGDRNDAGTFSNIGSNGYWWSSSESSIPNALARLLRYDGGDINFSVLNKRYGLSVRCLRD